MALFKFTEGFDDSTSEELYTNPAFLRHARGVVTMLDAAVSMLGPDLEPVTQALEDLGRRHVAYGVIPDHYPIVGQALLFTLETALGNELWTATVREGWTGVYAFVSTTMIRGAKIAMDENLPVDGVAVLAEGSKVQVAK
jgi:hypothetical protein